MQAAVSARAFTKYVVQSARGGAKKAGEAGPNRSTAGANAPSAGAFAPVFLWVGAPGAGRVWKTTWVPAPQPEPGLTSS